MKSLEVSMVYKIAPFRNCLVAIKVNLLITIFHLTSEMRNEIPPESETTSLSMLLFNPLAASPDYIHVFSILLTREILSNKKDSINQQDFKIVDLHFAKSE